MLVLLFGCGLITRRVCHLNGLAGSIGSGGHVLGLVFIRDGPLSPVKSVP